MPSHPLQVQPARLIHLPRMLTTHHRALSTDPMLTYIYDERTDGGFISSWCRYVGMYIFVAMFTAYKLFDCTNLQVDGGMAYVTIQPARDAPPPPDRILGWIIAFIIWVNQTFATDEQRKRDAEYNTKKAAATEKVLSEKHKYNLVFVLAADPAVHGKGYGRALMQAVCAQADARQEATWLNSTNARNRKFYEASGFRVIGGLTLGDDNPLWDGPPRRIDIMLREPQPLSKEAAR